jgi:hypothetical protein
MQQEYAYDVRDKLIRSEWDKSIKALEQSDDSCGDQSKPRAKGLEGRFVWKIITGHAMNFKCFHPTDVCVALYFC